MKQYRFFYHYYRQYDMMSVHFRGTCTKVKDIQCNVPCNTKYSNTQPYLRMEGKASNVEIIGQLAIIS